MPKIIIFSILSLMLLPSVCSADFDIVDWRFVKAIENARPGLNSFVIDDELFAGSEKDLRDLRIIDSAGQETAFKLLQSRAKSEAKTFYPKMLNNSYVEGESSSVILDFGANHQGVNSLAIQTQSENFQTSVRVSGSDDQSAWRVLKEDIYIYDYTDRKGNVKTQNTSVAFSESLFRYLKLEILDSSVRINAVTGQMTVRESAKELVRSAFFSQSENAAVSEIFIDLMQAGIPTGRLTLETADKNFNRPIVLSASFNNQDWRRVENGYIFRYDTPKFKGQNLALDFPELNERYLKLTIENLDNQPIAINNILTYSVYREIIFEAEAGKSYAVYYGNRKARWPQYDLEKYFQYLDLDDVKAVSLAKAADNARYEDQTSPGPDPKSEKIPWLMSVALLSASVILLFMVFQFFRKK